jgi:hypothetical protein
VSTGPGEAHFAELGDAIEVADLVWGFALAMFSGALGAVGVPAFVRWSARSKLGFGWRAVLIYAFVRCLFAAIEPFAPGS